MSSLDNLIGNFCQALKLFKPVPNILNQNLSYKNSNFKPLLKNKNSSSQNTCSHMATIIWVEEADFFF